MTAKTITDKVRTYLRSIGKIRANDMTGWQIHDAIFDRYGVDVQVPTILGIRQRFTGRSKAPGNTGKFNRVFKAK